MTGAGDISWQATEQMSDALGNAPGLPEGFITRFRALVRPSELVEMVLPIHMKHFDENTMQ